MGDAGGIPVTSAGYNSADGGFVREQIYSLVRQLDGGSLSTRDFRVKVAQLGTAVFWRTKAGGWAVLCSFPLVCFSSGRVLLNPTMCIAL